jgi:type III pantothenate kinase
MILELDCGNSWIKWRVLSLGAHAVLFQGKVADSEQLLVQLRALPGLQLQRCRLVSVRDPALTAELLLQLRRLFGLNCQEATSVAECAGVVNGYRESGRLGVDRWLAILGAYSHCAGACLVIDVGTAVTADFVTAKGEHVGGFIAPGLRLLGDQLGQNTYGVSCSYVSVADAGACAPGKSTVEAVSRGARIMLQGFIDAQVTMAIQYFGDDFQVVFTGGDAALVAGGVDRAVNIPDLVFMGLAIACP